MNKERLIEAFAKGLAKALSADQPPCAHGTLYRVENVEKANSNILKHWMRGRLREDDLLMIVNSLPNGHHTYALVQKNNEGYSLCDGSFHVASGVPGVKMTQLTKEQGLMLLERAFLPFPSEPLVITAKEVPRVSAV